MELVYSQHRERQELGRSAGPGARHPRPGGDMVAFETLVTRKTPAVVSLARRIVGNAEDARDVAQMVFLRVWNEIHRYDEKYSFNTWLYRIATNLSIDFLRSSRSRERAHGATLHLVREREESTAADATRNAEDAELARLFETVSGRLSEKQKAVFVLKEMQDCETQRDRRDSGLRRVHRPQPPLQRAPDPPQGDRPPLSGVPAREAARREPRSAGILRRAPSTTTGATRSRRPQRRILREHLAACVGVPGPRGGPGSDDALRAAVRAEEVSGARTRRAFSRTCGRPWPSLETERRIRTRRAASSRGGAAAAAAFGALLLVWPSRGAPPASRRPRSVPRRRRRGAASTALQPAALATATAEATEFRRTPRFTTGIPAPAGKSLGWSGSWIGGSTSRPSTRRRAAGL